MFYEKYVQQELDMSPRIENVYEVVRVEQVLMERPAGYTSTIVSSTSAGNMGVKEIGNDASEVVLVALLSTKNEINALHRVFTGSLNKSVAHPREIFRSAVLNNAARIIIYHNHPSGDLEPSDADMSFTRRLIQAGELMGIEVIDHIIVNSKEYLSMREESYI